jgi:serine/threonine-protein kinase RsbW
MAISNDIALAPATGAERDCRVVRLTIPARPEYVSLCRLALAGLARARPIPLDLVADLKVALSEAAASAVRHADGGGDAAVEIAFELFPDRLAVEVSDDAPCLDLTGEPGLDAGEGLVERELVLAVIRSIADEVSLERGPGGRGSRLRFVKLLAV